MDTPITSEWVPLDSAREITGWTRSRIDRAAEAGDVRTVAARGRRGALKYNRADLLRVAGILA